MNDNYYWRVGEILDQLVNVVFLEGDVGETISYNASTTGLSNRKRWACFLCVWIALTFEKDHCTKARHGVSRHERAGLWACLQLAGVCLVLLVLGCLLPLYGINLLTIHAIKG